MAQREALRELQARLAKRLQMAQTQGMSVAWLAVRAGGCNYLLPLGQSGEIVALSPVQRVPYTRPWFKGVLNVRGNLVGVVDLAEFMAANQGPDSPVAKPSAQASVITLNPTLEVNCALRVDALAGLRGEEAFTSQSAAPADAPAYFGACFVDQQAQSWQEIDMRALAQSPAFLNIAA